MIDSENQRGLEPIAIIGMACRFPGAETPEEFWRNLCEGVESITTFSDDELLRAGVDRGELEQPGYVKAAAVLKQIELFDAAFFDFTPQEARLLDPQHRLFLECAWEVFERAGYDPTVYPGRVGVFAGCGMNSYLLSNLVRNPRALEGSDRFQLVMSNDKDFLPARVSYHLNLKGPSVNVNTACSTSLVAVQMACQSLWNYQSDLALAGGVTLQVPQREGYLYQEGGILSPDGHCRPFDHRARGTVSGSGAAAVVLKRLSEAVAAGDTIAGLILGAAVNNDGSAKVGFTAPGVSGQAEVIAEAQSLAGIDAETITCLEAHGTGTPLGDPIELEALTQVFRARTGKKQFCGIGSVKGNFGHLDTAAGMAGLIKAVLSARHGFQPPTLHFEKPNPQIDFANSPFYVNTALTPWKTEPLPRRAGVSSFGIGGTNAHVIIEQPPSQPSSVSAREAHLLPLSARTAEALQNAAANLAAHFEQHHEMNLADAAFTLQMGRKAFEHRRVVVCRDLAGAIRLLNEPGEATAAARPAETARRPVAFLFPGGAQSPAMAELYRSESVFRESIDRCSEKLERSGVLKPRGQRLGGLLPLPAQRSGERAGGEGFVSGGPEGASAPQPSPPVRRGEGESSLGFIPGFPNLTDLHEIIFSSSKDAQSTGPVRESPASAEVALFVFEYALAQLWISWGIRPAEMIGQGVGEYVAAALSGLLPLDNALDLVAKRGRLIEGLAAGESVAPPLPEGEWERFRFSTGLEKLFHDPRQILLEVGPGRTLTTLALRHPQRNGEQLVLNCLPDANDSRSGFEVLLGTLGRLWTAGLPVEWSRLYHGERRLRLPLPTYPFQRQRYWIDPAPNPGPPKANRKKELVDWFYAPSWKRLPPLIPAPGKGSKPWRFVIFADACGLADALIASLPAPVTMVRLGSHWAKAGSAEYTIDPLNRAHYEMLLQEVGSAEAVQIIHLWNVTGPGSSDSPAADLASRLRRVEDGQNLGFFSLLFLAQAAGKADLKQVFKITVVSTGLHNVTGDERFCPEKALLLGPVKVLPQEYPNIQCRCIDVPWAHSDAERRNLARRLLDELDGPELMVAFRGEHRWGPAFEPFRIEPASSPFRKNGVYWITGGLGGVGLLVAEHLARTAKAKLVLTGRSMVPRREDWERLLANDEPASPEKEALAQDAAGLNLEEIGQDLMREETRLKRERNIQELEAEADPELASSIDRLCAAYILDYFAAKGVRCEKGTAITQADLRKQLGVLPVFTRFIDFFIRVLGEDRIVKVMGEQVEFLRGKSEVVLASVLHDEAVERFPQVRGLLALLRHCAESYPRALAGEIPAISVLYPEGRADLLAEAERNTIEDAQEKLYSELLRNLAVTLARKSPGRPARILEIGGGNGSLTEAIVPSLRGLNVEYHFTDLGRSFVLRAERQSAELGLDFMRFGVFDITRDAEAQGWHRGTFDLILGFNVVHVSPRIRDTVRNLQSLLVPGGILALLETVNPLRWNDMIWGLADGWWLYEDTDLRNGSPLLRLPQWKQALSGLGFGGVKVIPEEPSRAAQADCGLILAQRAPEAIGTAIESGPRAINPSEFSPSPPRSEGEGRGEVAGCGLNSMPAGIDRRWMKLAGGDDRVRVRNTIAALKRLEALGSEVLVLQADVSNAEEMRRAAGQARERFGEVHGVIHAAMNLQGSTIDFKDAGQARGELAPKVQGTVILDELCREMPLDFIAFFSSHIAITGGVGTVGYCAASAFLDAFGQESARKTPRQTVVINWDRWRGAGRAVSIYETWYRARTGEDLPEGMTAAEGLAAFERILSSRLSGQVIVATEDFSALVRESEHFQLARGGLDLKPVVAHGRPELSSAYLAPRNETEQKIAGIWQVVLGISAIGALDDFAELGGDSLIAIQVISRLREAFGVELTVRFLYERPTIAALAEGIENIRWSRPAPEGGAVPRDEEEVGIL